MEHPFQQKYIIQQNYQLRRFLFWHYKKKVERVVIPTGLCELCNKLKIQHND